MFGLEGKPRAGLGLEQDRLEIERSENVFFDVLDGWVLVHGFQKSSFPPKLTLFCQNMVISGHFYLRTALPCTHEKMHVFHKRQSPPLKCGSKPQHPGLRCPKHLPISQKYWQVVSKMAQLGPHMNGAILLFSPNVSFLPLNAWGW